MKVEQKSQDFLSTLKPGEKARVVGRPVHRRLLALGLRPGARVELLLTAPWGDPLEIKVEETLLLLRRKEAEGILVERM
ncbi:MAG: FeoA family protein [Thermaceae bacterium]